MAGRPKMCGSCGKLMGVADVCPYCGADSRRVRARVKRAVSGHGLNRGLGAYPVTTFMVGANVFMFIVAVLMGGVHSGGGMELLGLDGETLLRLGGHFTPAIAVGEWWRLFMAIFLHGGIVHVFFNSYVLWIAGRHVEAEFGSRLMFLIYMLAGVLGFVASYVAGIMFTVGASGAISGLLGALLVRRWLVDGGLRHPVTLWVLQLIVLTAIFGFVVSQVNNVAHLVGLLTGAAIAFALTKLRLSKAAAVGLMLVTTGIAFATVAAVGLMLLGLAGPTGQEVVDAARCADHAAEALSDEGRGVQPGLATTALSCFDDLPGIGGAADEGIEAMRRGLRAGLEAHQDGDLVSEQEAARGVARGHRMFQRWLDANYARYGLSRGG